MKIEIGLKENSYDYFTNALELYKIADENGIHKKEKAIIQNKSKWKLAFVSLVQAFELILKYGLFSINPVLIYSDIDSINLSSEKTVSYSSALLRLRNFNNNPYTENEEKFIKNCFIIRNQFIHYTVNITTEEIKKKFATLYVLYRKGYENFVHIPLFASDSTLVKIGNELEFFRKNIIIFRGEEMHNESIENYKAEIAKYSKVDSFVTSSGKLIKRIAFGEENHSFHQNENEEYMLYDFEFCDDCGAKQGEYHLPDCDLEVCPICYGQKLTCGCDLQFPIRKEDYKEK